MSKATEKKSTHLGCALPKELPKYEYQTIAYSSGGISSLRSEGEKYDRQIVWPKNFAQ